MTCWVVSSLLAARLAKRLGGILVATALLTCLLSCALAEQLEGALLRLVASGEQMLLGGGFSERMLAAADNPAMLILHQILLCQATRCLISSAVPNLCLGTYYHSILIPAKKQHNKTSMASFSLKKTLFWSVLVVLIAALLLVYAGRGLIPKPKPLIQDQSKPLLVWVMRAYVPNMTAGAEITCHVTNKQLLKDGFEVTVIVKHYVTDRQDGVKILKSQDDLYDASAEAQDALQRASVICIQNLDYSIGMDLARKYRKPVCFFIHATSRGKEFFGYAGSWPIHVVYNSWSMKADIAANYKNYVLKPYVDMAKFKPLAAAAGSPNRFYVTLINLNESKGGRFLTELAKAMPEVQFLGVEGGYGEQIRDTTQRNITYMSKTDKIEEVYAKSRIVIMPSDLETWGRVAVEAMASGVPVIVNDVQGMREACQEGALVADRGDIGSWIRQIRRLRNDPMFYSEQVRKAQQRIAELEDDSDMKGLAGWLRSTVIPSKPSELI